MSDLTKSPDLSAPERDRLAELEEVVNRGLRTFVEVGSALAEIRDSRLYRAKHGTFEAYCRERWAMTDRRARQLMTAASTAKEVGTGTTVPENEAQARPLTRLKDPEQRREAWGKAVEESGGKPTGKDVEGAVRSMSPEPKPAPWEGVEPSEPPKSKAEGLRAKREQDAASVVGSIEPEAKLREPSDPEKEFVADREARAHRTNVYSHIGKIVYFAGTIRGDKNLRYAARMLVEYADEFERDQKDSVQDVLDACRSAMEWLPRFVAEIDDLRDEVEHDHARG